LVKKVILEVSLVKKPYVFITRKLPNEQLSQLKAFAEVKMWEYEEKPVPAEILLQEAKKADALLTMLSDRIDKTLLSEAQNLKVVANLAVGYDNIDVQFAKNLGIHVCHTPDVLTNTTADLAFALVMTAARRITEAYEFVKEGKWVNWSPFLLAGNDIYKKTIGIVGMGRIGQAVAKRATGFDMNILYHNRTRNEAAEERLGAQYCSFDEILIKSDYIVCLTPLTPETENMFNKEAFGKMKKTATFINVSRGSVVDEDDLYEALVNKEIASAGLDVFRKEPISKDHPLLALPNVVALPHIGSASHETRTTMVELACKNIELVLKGEEPRTPIR
jgi:glyoxylate reductase